MVNVVRGVVMRTLLRRACSSPRIGGLLVPLIVEVVVGLERLCPRNFGTSELSANRAGDAPS
jgi:hypothetical protein